VLNPPAKRVIGSALAVSNAPRAMPDYLRATSRHLCLLMNFGTPRLEFWCRVMDLRSLTLSAFICALCVHLRYDSFFPARGSSPA
jgi:hypothetical protein